MKCKKCGHDTAIVDTSTVPTGNPPQYSVWCTTCGYRDTVYSSEASFVELVGSYGKGYTNSEIVKKFEEEHPIFIPVENKPTKILCVEDGAVNMEEVKNMCTYAKIFLLVYKKGSKPPFILDVGE